MIQLLKLWVNISNIVPKVIMTPKIRKVSVIGLGYVGLPVYVALAKTKKYEVVGFTINEEHIKLIDSGISPINDDGVSSFLKNNKITATNNKDPLQNSDVFIVCVPTPVKNDYQPDYGPVLSAARLVAPLLKKGCHFVLESTVNPGTCEELVLPILEKGSKLRAGIDFNIAHCPERINPGDKKWTIYNINRNIGSLSPEFNKEISNFYKTFITKAIINEVSSLKVAEASKIIENAFRDINIAYVNELARSFDLLNIDLIETLTAASNKPFGFMTHWPGAGVGGHCIGIDPYYLIERANQAGFTHHFLKLAREINNQMPEYTIERLVLGLNEVGLPVRGTSIAVLGLSYKPEMADFRESPSIKILSRLKNLGAKIRSYDPYIPTDYINLESVLEDSQAIVLVTAHKEFIEKLPKLIKNSSVKIVVDGRNCLPKEEIEQLGIIYKGIGR